MTGHAKDMLGARQKQGASRLGISVAEYARENAAGNEWCSGCRAWEPRESFGLRRGRWNRLNSQCREAARAAARINTPRLRERKRAS